jgi:hypothetical protein
MSNSQLGIVGNLVTIAHSVNKDSHSSVRNGTASTPKIVVHQSEKWPDYIGLDRE